MKPVHLAVLVLSLSIVFYALFPATEVVPPWERIPFYHKSNIKIDTNRDVSLVVHLSYDRIPRLLDLCEKWKGPISASYFASKVSHEEKLQILVNTSSCIANYVDIHFVRPRTVISEDMQVSYPFNIMRNEALTNTRTTYVFLLDIDFHIFPPKHYFYSRIVQREEVKNRESFWVSPAFETISSSTPLPQTKEELLHILNKRLACPFYGHYCVNCHLPTNYKLWETASSSYQVPYLEGYEPYILANKSILPRYDERFVGRGWDKMSFFYELHALNYSPWVVPEIFIVHQGRPNQPTNYTKEYMNNFHNNQQHWANFKAEIQAKYTRTNSSL